MADKREKFKFKLKRKIVGRIEHTSFQKFPQNILWFLFQCNLSTGDQKKKISNENEITEEPRFKFKSQFDFQETSHKFSSDIDKLYRIH